MPDTKSPQHRYPAELRERAVRMVFETIEQRKERYGVVTRVATTSGSGPSPCAAGSTRLRSTVAAVLA